MGNPSSLWGPRDLNGRTFHHGIDVPAPIGTKVLTKKELTVTQATVQTGYGNVVYAVDNAGTEYRFAHLDNFGPGVKKGTVLAPGDQVGWTGITGAEADGRQTSTGAHLHYEVRRAGKSVDPLTTIDPSTGKPYINNATFDGGNTSSLRTSIAMRDPSYTPNGTVLAQAPGNATNGRNSPTNNATVTRSLQQPKTGTTPVSTKPDSIKVPRINPLLKLGD